MEKKTSSQLLSAFWPGLLVALIIAVSLAGIAGHDLWTPDEPREAAIALGMSQSGNLIIPELAGQPFVEKPPLFYIIASFFLRAFGQIIGNTAALRLVSACFGLLTLFFTYLLGKIYFGRQKALIAAGILATMIGFVHVTHWLLVDNALMFFITASVWALAKAYENNRLSYLPLAGIITAFAFLSKGLIGPLIIFIVWLGLFLPWIKKLGPIKQDNHSVILPASNSLGDGGSRAKDLRHNLSIRRRFLASLLRRSKASGCEGWTLGMTCHVTLKFLGPAFSQFLSKRILGIHLVSLSIALLISAIWVVAFALKGGPELFREWWWTNHFGRFAGQTTHLGHIAPWYYYFTVLPVYTLPWFVPLVVALIVLFKKILRKETIPSGIVFLSFWILGAFLLLSLSATKREIYLSVLLPACALLCIYGLDDRAGKVGEKIYRLWMFLLFIVLAAFIAAPLVGSDFFGLSFISFTFEWRQILAFATIIISALTLLSFRTPFLQRFLIIAAICYATLLVIICPAVDRYKSYGPAFRSAAYAIKAHPELKVAGWNLDETTVAGFYYYCGMMFPVISDRQMLDDVLHGRNHRFNGVLSLVKNASSNDLPEKENQVIFESRMGKRRLLQLLAARDWEKKGKESEVSSQ